MKNLMLNHEKLIAAIKEYELLADFTTTDFDRLVSPIVIDEKKPAFYTGQVRINIADEAIVFIYFKTDKTVSFLVQGRDVVLGGTVVSTLINMVKRG